MTCPFTPGIVSYDRRYPAQQTGCCRKEMGLVHLLTFLVSRLRDDEGATMVEYGIMVALIAVVSILVVAAVGLDVFAIFSDPRLDLP